MVGGKGERMGMQGYWDEDGNGLMWDVCRAMIVLKLARPGFKSQLNS